jgi:chloride channel, nucleotide-sensitive, 1A
MPFHILQEAPALSSFTPLSTHQSETPESFFSGPPVLHYHTEGAHVIVPRDQRDALPIFGAAVASESGANGAANVDEDDHSIIVHGFDVMVTSE